MPDDWACFDKFNLIWLKSIKEKENSAENVLCQLTIQTQWKPYDLD